MHRTGRLMLAVAAFCLARLDACNAATLEAGIACSSDVMFVLDASGSMSASDFPDGAPNRIDRVRQALARVIPEVAKVRRIGLIVYGPGGNNDSCRNVELKLKPSWNAAQTVLQIADRLRPEGRTPLARSVELAIDALKDSTRPAEVVVLTDGEDTCGGDPCRLAQRIRESAPGITVHVVGFKLAPVSDVDGARCLAETTGGKFVTAETTDQLTDALRRTMACPQLSRKPVDMRSCPMQLPGHPGRNWKAWY